MKLTVRGSNARLAGHVGATALLTATPTSSDTVVNHCVRVQIPLPHPTY